MTRDLEVKEVPSDLPLGRRIKRFVSRVLIWLTNTPLPLPPPLHCSYCGKRYRHLTGEESKGAEAVDRCPDGHEEWIKNVGGGMDVLISYRDFVGEKQKGR